jgi:hypothetical protein
MDGAIASSERPRNFIGKLYSLPVSYRARYSDGVELRSSRTDLNKQDASLKQTAAQQTTTLRDGRITPRGRTSQGEAGFRIARFVGGGFCDPGRIMQNHVAPL